MSCDIPPSKPGSTNSPQDDCSDEDDDELVTWLQYPLEDSFEKTYCSDALTLKPHIPSSSSSSSSFAHNRSRTSASFFSDASASMSLCADTDHLRTRSNGGPSLHTRLANAKAGMMLQRSASTEGALAMGAHRAAAAVLAPRSSDATLLLPANPRGPQSQAQRIPKIDISVRSNSMPVPGALADKLLYRQAQTGGLQLSFASSPWPAQYQNQPSNQRIQNYNCEGRVSASRNATSSADRLLLRKELEATQVPVQVQVPSSKGCSNITEETVWTSSDYMSQEYRFCDAQKGSSSCGSFPGSRRLTLGGGGGGGASSYVSPPPLQPPSMPMVVATCSGGSQASADLSTQDEGHKGKRKAQEISECQSEEVDEESVEIKQPQRTSSKRNRAAEVHNLSERNRRNRINEKLKALQDLIPNSTKTDKASVLDEAIEYMKSLQMQLQMVSMRSNMNMSPVMIPVGMPHLQMTPLQTVGLGFPIGHPGMGMAMGVGQGLMPSAYQSAIPGVNHFIMPYQDATTNEIQGASKPEFPTTDILPQSPEQGHTRVHGMFSTSPHHQQGPRVSHHLDSP